MSRTRIVLLFNEDNEKQMVVCDYLKSQPRCKTALITELVYQWLKAKENDTAILDQPVVQETKPDMQALKASITEELLGDRNFIEKVIACVSSQMQDKQEGVLTESPGEADGEEDLPMDFDEAMLLNGMAVFEV
jgi:hypothetical protein